MYLKYNFLMIVKKKMNTKLITKWIYLDLQVTSMFMQLDQIHYITFKVVLVQEVLVKPFVFTLFLTKILIIPLNNNK